MCIFFCHFLPAGKPPANSLFDRMKNALTSMDADRLTQGWDRVGLLNARFLIGAGLAPTFSGPADATNPTESMLAAELTDKPTLTRSSHVRKETTSSRSPRGNAPRLKFEKSENEMILEYLPLVKTVVGRLQMSLPSHVDAEDLHSAGLIGLLDALRHYNPRLGSNFESYARVRIRGAIFDELRRMDWVPRSIHRKARKVQKTIADLEQRQGRQPTPAELAAELGMTLADYHQLLDEIRPATFVCLDAAMNPEHDDSPSHYEMLADPNQCDPLAEVEHRETVLQLAGFLERLPSAQKKVLALYYYENLRLREIAEVFGLTESRICQIHSQAILALKAMMRNSNPMQN